MNSLPDQQPGTPQRHHSVPADEVSKIVHEFMRNFVVRPAVEPGDKAERVIRAWREAASSGR